VRIVEGARYKLGRVDVQGASTFKPEELQAYFRDLVGKNFSRKEYNAALEQARRLYADAGYITTEVADDMDFDRSKGEVRSTLLVQEGPKIQVGKVLLERPRMIDPKPSWFGKIYGYVAPPVKDDVIAKEAKLKPGSVYEKRKEELAEERLRRLDVFETAKIESQATNNPTVRDARISVEEGVTGNLMVGVGISDALGAFVWTSFSEKNIGGRADVITVGGELGQKASSGRASYLDRHVGNSDTSMQYQLYYTDTDQPGYHEKIAGAAVEAGIPMESLSSSQAFGEGMWKMYLRARGESVSTDKGDYDPEADFDRDYVVATGRVRVVRDGVTTEKLDGKNYDKTGGYLAGVGLEAGEADGPLTKLTAELNTYKKVTKKLVFASEMQAGFMPNNADDIGPTERFYLGGTDDLRGFKYRQAGPHDSGDHDVPLGGATKLLARNELRYPLFESITGVMFLDAGTLDEDAFKIGEPRASTGVGLRIKIKRMEMGVDLAVPVLTQDHDQKRFFHFNIKGGVTP
jgi:outer membrane protein insertion porin family